MAKLNAIKPNFKAEQFTATQWTGAEGKAKAANQLAAFVMSGFDRKKFTKSVYQTLHLHMFHHIAHYDINGFYATWFDSWFAQHDWVKHALSQPIYGDPTFTWSDVEPVFQDWLTKNAIEQQLRVLCEDAQEAVERQRYEELKSKFGDK